MPDLSINDMKCSQKCPEVTHKYHPRRKKLQHFGIIHKNESLGDFGAFQDKQKGKEMLEMARSYRVEL